MLIAFVSVRAIVLISSPYSLFDDEEIYNGTAARELARGASLPLEALLYFPHEGGALLLTVLAAPIVWLLGDGLIAVKLAPLIVSALALLAWVRLANRFIDRRTTLVFAALLTFAPPLVQRSDLMLWGHHNSVSVFMALAFYDVLAVLGAGDTRQRTRQLARLGLVCGFGLFFAPIFAVALLTVLIALGSSRSIGIRSIGPAALGFAVGFSPWLIVNAQLGFAGLNVFADEGRLRHADFATAARKIWTLLFEVLPRSASFDDAASSALYALLAALSVAGVGWAFRRRPPSDASTPERPTRIVRLAWLYLASFLLVYAASGFDLGPDVAVAPESFISYRYLLPAFPVVALLVALNAARRDARRALRAAPAAALVVMGAFGLTTARATLGASFDFPGYSYERFGWRWYERTEGDAGRLNAIGRAIDSPMVADYYRGASWGLGEFYTDDVEAALAWIERLPTGYRDLGYEGLGWGVAATHDGDLAEGQKIAGRIDAARRSAFYRGFGWAVGKRHHLDLAQGLSWLGGVEAAARGDAYQGFGRALDEQLGDDTDNWLALRPELGPGDRTALSRGAGQAAVRRSRRRFVEGPLQMPWGPTVFYGYAGPRNERRGAGRMSRGPNL